ncbi:SIR2 family protein [Chitinibacter sp. SCUT-21]|uniref:hypothetical protein n=1 Tax=Chitinibacter sp. SCUT-21 TaxID=2970891 RepID=UPI0035A6780F
MVTLLFGAGASYGSGRCFPHAPPLGNDLFQKLIELNGAFALLDDDSKQVFIDKGFEAGMATVDNDSRVINPLQKELACYLSSFTVAPDNAYVRLCMKLRNSLAQITIVTLNYDLLIEQALQMHGLDIDYNCSNAGVNLIKPHGSSNFLPELPRGMSFSGSTMVSCGAFFEGLPTNAVGSHEEVKSWCLDDRNSDLSPVLAMYAEGKRVVINPRTILAAQNEYSKRIASSELVVLVGVRYVPHDNHIWDPISERMPKLLIVDPYPLGTTSWADANGLSDVIVIKKGFEDSVWDIKKAVQKVL